MIYRGTLWNSPDIDLEDNGSDLFLVQIDVQNFPSPARDFSLNYSTAFKAFDSLSGRFAE